MIAFEQFVAFVETAAVLVVPKSEFAINYQSINYFFPHLDNVDIVV